MKKSRIISISDDIGNVFQDKGVAVQFVSHFQNFLGTCDEVFHMEMSDCLFKNKVDAESALHMIREVSNEEIKVALFDIKDDKAPRPDGFTSKFFKSSWEIIGKDLCAASAFIKGRQICDNIMLAQELMCGYMIKNKVARCAFKVDTQKAYDTVSWEFLETCLLKFSFHKVMVGWIMINNEKRFKYHWRCMEMKIVNLYFADDLMMFFHGDVILASVLKRAMDEFCLSSGLRPSMAKSTVYFGNVTDEIKKEIKMVMPFNEGCLPVRYLGIPLDANMISRSDCILLLDKVRKRIEDWRNKDLSFAGRLQLIASVLGSVNNSLFMNTKVADLVIGDKWNWPRNWNMRIKDVLGTQVPKINSEIDDKVVWVNKKGKVKDFCVSEVWNGIRDSSAKVIWHEHVWFTQCVPTLSFVLCMAIKAKLKTQDRISRWLNIQDMSCPFCKRLVWGATVYFIWQERNIRLFGNGGRSGVELFKVIFESVRSRLIGLKLKVTPDVINAVESFVLKAYGATSATGAELVKRCRCLTSWSMILTGSSMKCNLSSTWISSSGIAKGSSANHFFKFETSYYELCLISLGVQDDRQLFLL
ncbi:pentatricopeptide repeat-containing protein [Tanacetum coccineum]